MADRSAGEWGWKSRLLRVCLAFSGIAAFVAFSVTLENEVGIPFKTTYRVACAVACLALMAKVGSEYRWAQWSRIAVWLAILFNAGLFFSPLAQLPAPKGDLLFFGAPDAAIMLAARIGSYEVTDDHQRAIRQQMIVGLILALAFCAIILAMMFIPSRVAR